jgi:hypothetical protein
MQYSQKCQAIHASIMLQSRAIKKATGGQARLFFEAPARGRPVVGIRRPVPFRSQQPAASAACWARVGRRSRGGETRRCGRLVDPRLFGPPFPTREWYKRLRAQCPDTKAEAAVQKCSAVLSGIQFDAARHTNPPP